MERLSMFGTQKVWVNVLLDWGWQSLLNATIQGNFYLEQNFEEYFLGQKLKKLEFS